MDTLSDLSVPAQLKSALERAIFAALHDPDVSLPPRSFSRPSPLSAEKMIELILAMRGGSLNSELHDAGIAVSKSAFSKRRKLIPPAILESLFNHFNALCTDFRRFKGYQVLTIDGTTVNMARNPDAPTFMQHAGNPKGINQFHVNALYDVLNKTYLDAVIQPQPRMDEVGALLFLLAWHNFPEKTLIVTDRGYESYAVIASFFERTRADCLIRVRSGNFALKPIAALPMQEFDRDISFTISTTRTKEDIANGHIFVPSNIKDKPGAYRPNQQRWPFSSPYPMKLRVLRFRLDTGEYETLVTTLPRSITMDGIRELYHARWGIETAFRELKYGLGLTNLHGKSDDYVRQELWASMTMANYCNRIIGAVELPKRRKATYAYQVNATMAVKLCRDYLRAPDADGAKLMRQIARYSEPVRPGRQDERNLKAKSFVGFCYRVAA